MRFGLNLDGAPDRIELLAPAPGCRFRLGDGPVLEAHVAMAEPGVYSVLMDGRSYDARIEEQAEHPDRLVVVIDGYRFEAEVRDPRRWSQPPGGRGHGGLETIAALMPGKVVRVLVSPGDTVETGQGLVVVEAMKMQNEMKAQRAGRVLTVSAREGATVAAGEPLVTIE